MLRGLFVVVFSLVAIVAAVLAAPVNNNNAVEMELESNITSVKLGGNSTNTHQHPSYSSSEEMHDPSVVSGRAVRSPKKSDLNEQVATTTTKAAAVAAAQKSKATTKKKATTKPPSKQQTSAVKKPSPSGQASPAQPPPPNKPYIEMYDEPMYQPNFYTR